MISLNTVLEVLSEDKPVLRDLGVKSLSVFGSVARGDASEDSDIDILVEFEGTVGYFGLARLRRHLEALLDARVDLVTPGGLRDSMRARVLGEAVRAA